MAFRFDAIRLDASKISKTGSGAMRIPALVARSGVFAYQDASGRTINEWRPPDEVLKADSIASLKDLPVTNRHPKNFVDPTTWRGTAIGHVSSESPRADATAGGVMADLVISDASAQAKIGTDLVEVSCGYRVDLDETPGVVPAGMPDAGKRYDRIQRNIDQNHVAIGPRQWGRQGSAVAMRLDSAGDEIAPVEVEEAPPMKHTIKLDGKTFEADTEAELQAKVDAHFADKARADAATASTASTAEVERLKGELAATNTKLAQEKARADAAPEAVKASMVARTALETVITGALGKAFKCDGKTDRDLKVDLVKHFDSTFSATGADGKPVSDDFLEGQYAAWSKVKPAEGARVDAGTRRIALGLQGAGGDGRRADGATETLADPYDVDAARARRDTKREDAFKKPIRGELTRDAAEKSAGAAEY